MRVGILETGEPPAHLAAFGSYPSMFCRLLERGGFDFTTFDVRLQLYPASATDHDAYIVTGSAEDAYRDVDWILRLKHFLNEVRGRVPLVGICFGHQVMAEAFGGRVARASAGWGIGLHRYEVIAPRSWAGDERFITLPASHQDQVIDLPPQAEVVAGSAFCPNGVLAYRYQPAMSMQLHPEFNAAYSAALTMSKQGVVSDEAIDSAMTSLRAPADQEIAGRWIHDFLRGVA